MKGKGYIVSVFLLVLPTVSFASDNWADRVQVSGVVEVEAGAVDDSSVDSSDIATATVQLGIEATINDGVTGHVLLLHEEDDTPLEVDEGSITVSLNGQGSVYLTAGQMYVPFGNFESHMVSDPLTLELGETRQSILQVGFDNNGLYGSAYLFNGTTIENGGDDSVENFGANVGYVMESDSLNIDLGASYISNIADSFGIMDNLPTTGDDINALDSYVDGFAIYAIANAGAMTGIFEYVSAGEFESTELSFDADGASPAAMNVEFGYGINDSSTIAIAYQMTEEAVALGLVENKLLLSYSTEIYDATTLSFEYAQGDYYSVADGGSDEDMSAIMAQLAVEF